MTGGSRTGAYAASQPAHSPLILWLDAADPQNLFADAGMTTNVSAAGGTVAVWKDKSAKGNNATALAAGAYKPAAIGVRGAFYAPGGLAYTLSDPRLLQNAAAVTVFAVCQATQAPCLFPFDVQDRADCLGR